MSILVSVEGSWNQCPHAHQILRDGCRSVLGETKVIHRFSTMQGFAPLIPPLFKGQLYFQERSSTVFEKGVVTA